MALLSINEEELDRFIAKRVREGVSEKSWRNAEKLLIKRCSAAKMHITILG